MKRQFRRGAKTHLLLILVAAVLLIAVGVRLFQLLRPLSPLDPLEQDITIGQKVVGNWIYGGITDQNRLQFFNGFDIVTLPPGTREFAGDGDFVVIEKATPSMLTVKRSRVYIWESSAPWFFLAAMIGMALAALVYRESRVRRRSRFYRRRTVPGWGQRWRWTGSRTARSARLVRQRLRWRPLKRSLARRVRSLFD
jgi:hypothetical protein